MIYKNFVSHLFGSTDLIGRNLTREEQEALFNSTVGKSQICFVHICASPFGISE